MIKDKLELLSKPIWTRADIMLYCEVSKTQATKIKKRAVEEFDGSCPYGDSYVKVESVLALFGTNTEQQVERLSSLEKKLS